MSIQYVSQIISDAQLGKPFIIVDEASRENEGDLVVAADKVTPDIINFMITECKGLVCLTITEKLRSSLELEMMPKRHSGKFDAAFTVTFDGVTNYGVGTGISASDRAKSIKLAISGNKESIRTPGHVFPLVAQEGGLKVRQGHTEASVEIMKLAGLDEPAAVICEIINPDGNMARFPDIERFATEHNINIISTTALVKYIEENGL